MARNGSEIALTVREAAFHHGRATRFLRRLEAAARVGLVAYNLSTLTAYRESLEEALREVRHLQTQVAARRRRNPSRRRRARRRR